LTTRSKKITEPTTRPPEIRPISTAPVIETVSAPAVIPTSPARMPLSAIERSGLLTTNQLPKIAATQPAAAARQVVTRVKEVRCGSADSTEPPLNPNQPSHSRKTPTAASGMLLPGIGASLPFTYFPMRGPSIQAPTRAPQPPTECTRVEPAKS
jgi:hypothetical protein